ncbi:MAG TPA: GDP-mannose 4,6-dehydratase, partial [Actinomycetota bacterium]|nr:GDP-mannose 4,6-dehydratase [Actinomycetota bacterium]
NLAEHEGDPRFTFELGDVADLDIVAPLVAAATHIVHAAAESFVDRSIEDPHAFVVSNVLGTQVVLEACRQTATPMTFVSTDEVYGANTADALFDETDPFRPRSPYAASKAGADLLCQAYVITYRVPVTTVRGTNTFGPRQHPEKAIPTFVLAALDERPVPVYGRGEQRREWLYVRDFVTAIATVMDTGEPGGVYNIGGGHELANVDLARQVLRVVGAGHSTVSFVQDRPGHDFRYGVRWDRLARLGWGPATSFEDGLALTVAWYREHRDWVETILRAAAVR